MKGHIITSGKLFEASKRRINEQLMYNKLIVILHNNVITFSLVFFELFYRLQW